MKQKQCVSCPWRVDCEPLSDIPNGYSVELHEALRGTIARPGDTSCLFGQSTQRIMACHYSPVGEEIPCAGWLANQLGAGNNIWLRIEVARGRLPVPELIGNQHRTFDETLPAQADGAHLVMFLSRRSCRTSAALPLGCADPRRVQKVASP